RKNVPGARLVAVADPFEEARRAACDTLGIDLCYKDYRDALENPEIQALVVVTPTVFHRDTVIDAAASGRHILCEKPMAINESECRDMIDATKEQGVKLQIGFMRRFDAGFRQAKEVVESGAIGDVVMVRSNTRGPSVPQPWMYDLAKSNGPLAEVNSHDIDTLRWFTGSEFCSVYAIGGNFRSPQASAEFPEFYDNVVLISSFANGCQGMIDGAQGVGYGYDARTEVLGTKGCVFIGRLREHSVVTCTTDSHEGVYPVVQSWRQLFEPAYLAEDVAFINSIANDTLPEVTGIDGMMAVRVVNAGNRSIIEKRIVQCSAEV
ncbi:MAG: Gfo/Idh/MocA family oxidoreductase, partial [Synergistaceae bacterium]|nr:Gfo/Idh/MocA family oxidoreductase [Synergistaceae bacterium]